jgi:hypothetical protein
MVLHPPPTKTKTRRGRKREIPPQLRQAALESGRRLRLEFGPLFAANPGLKRRAVGLIESQLPPRRRRPGRPGYRLVTRAIQLRAKLRRVHPEMSAKEIWREIYRSLILNYHSLPRLERRQAQDQLRRRVNWRLRAQRRRRRKSAGGQPQQVLSVL